MQIPMINGIYTDHTADYRTSYPLNLVPVPKQNGISQGYLRKMDGIALFCTLPNGKDRGGINWQGVLYRVVGDGLYRINRDGSFVKLGDVAGDNPVSFAYSFDRLAVAGGDKLYYLQGDTLTQVTDSDLGRTVAVVWIDGYFLTTDGEYIIQTELNDPTQIAPLKYGSSEIDPDPVVGLLKVRNELAVFNRYSIEIFDNVGGSGFAFARIDGAMMTKGAVGAKAMCNFAQSFAFVGGGKNEPCSLYLGANGGLTKIATREIEKELAILGDDELAGVVLESVNKDMHEWLLVHLPHKTLVYDFSASQVMQTPIWFGLSSSTDGKAVYRGINFVWCYNKWTVGDRWGGNIGYLDNTISTHYGSAVAWQIDTTFVYAGGSAGQIKSVELVGLTGRNNAIKDPQVFLSWSKDGMTWSNERLHRQGLRGQFGKRIMWFRAIGLFHQMVSLRFRGCDDSLASFSAIEIDVEAFGNVGGGGGQ